MHYRDRARTKTGSVGLPATTGDYDVSVKALPQAARQNGDNLEWLWSVSDDGSELFGLVTEAKAAEAY